MYEIVVGRIEEDRKKYGLTGTVLLGKHYVRMGQTTSLSNKILMDVTRSHIVFVCGKRGGGKSYTMGVIAEGMANLEPEISQNLSIIMLDTMGIYWTMKFPNQKDEDLLKEWDLKPKGLNVIIYTPTGYYKIYKEKGIPTDRPFSIIPSELSPMEWAMTFEVSLSSPIGVALEKIVMQLKDERDTYSIQDIIDAITKDKEIDDETKQAAINRFTSAEHWGLFSDEGTPLSDLVQGGQVVVLDVSCYATIPGTEGIKSLVIGLVAQKLFIQRMIARKNEEFQDIHKSMNFLSEEDETRKEMPLVWLIIDEAHEFLPREGKNAATEPLVTILREGRQPGISLVLATQQPAKIHTDVMTQSDIVISHRITAKVDTDSLGMLMQSYMRQGLDVQLSELPSSRGSALIFDDNNERVYPMRVRPRFTWHGGEAPTALPKKKKIFETEI
jgi:uncharacterized protein